MDTLLEYIYQAFMEADQEKREGIKETLREAFTESGDKKIYQMLINMENQEYEENLTFGEDYSPKQEL